MLEAPEDSLERSIRALEILVEVGAVPKATANAIGELQQRHIASLRRHDNATRHRDSVEGHE
jgi:hypothetical protein